jgi:hypothetical protein
MPTTRRAGLVLAAVAATLLALAGCGHHEEAPAPVPVEGKLTTPAGKPVAHVILTFFPRDEANRGQRFQATADKDGRFSTRCLPGRYKVALTPVPTQHGQADPTGGGVAPPPGAGSPAVPANYRSEPQTPLEADIPAGGKQDLVLVVR